MKPSAFQQQQIVNAMMQQGNNTDMIGPHGPRMAGVRVPVGDMGLDKISLRNEDGMWNVGGQGYYDVPTDGLQKRVASKFNRTGNRRRSMFDVGEEVLDYDSDDASDEGLGMASRINLWDTRDKLDRVKLGFKKGYVGANKNALGVTASVGSREDGDKQVKYIDTGIFDGKLSKSAIATLVHEYQHAADIYGGDMRYGEDYDADRKNSYWDRGYEAFARLAGNSAFRKKDMTSAKGDYAVHPMIDFDPKSGSFSLGNAETYFNAKVRDGKMTKKEGLNAMEVLEQERYRLTQRKAKDNAFASKLYAYHPAKRMQKSKKGRQADRDQRGRAIASRGNLANLDDLKLWE